MYAYSKYNGTDWHVDCSADIAAIYFSDEGESWSDSRIIAKHDDNSKNYMCVNLFRTNAGKLAMIYTRKDPDGSAIPYFMVSDDESKTLQNPIPCVDRDGYYCIENARTIVLSSGRIILPMNLHSFKGSDRHSIDYFGKMVFTASDDDGKSWKLLCEPVPLSYPEGISESGLQETAVYETDEGVLRAFSRTDLFCQYESRSSDGGSSWSTPVPNKYFSSPVSPIVIEKTSDTVYAVFNPTPNFTTRNGDRTNPLWYRTPLLLVQSHDDEKTFDKSVFLEDDPDDSYCYPTLFDGGEYLLAVYYHSNGSHIPLSSNKIVKVLKEDIC